MHINLSIQLLNVTVHFMNMVEVERGYCHSVMTYIIPLGLDVLVEVGQQVLVHGDGLRQLLHPSTVPAHCRPHRDVPAAEITAVQYKTGASILH